MKTVLGFIVAGIVLFFKYGPGKRFLTQKASNSPGKADSYVGEVQEIRKEDYQRFILIKGSGDQDILSMIKEDGALFQDDDFIAHTFKISKTAGWSIVWVDQTVSFYAYHNLVGSFGWFDFNADFSAISIGYAKHISDSQKDYFFYLDPNNTFGDTEIGAFRNGDSFFIYLPEAYEDYGNLKICATVSSNAEATIELLNENGLDIKSLSELEYEDHTIQFNE